MGCVVGQEGGQHEGWTRAEAQFRRGPSPFLPCGALGFVPDRVSASLRSRDHHPSMKPTVGNRVQLPEQGGLGEVRVSSGRPSAAGWEGVLCRTLAMLQETVVP